MVTALTSYCVYLGRSPQFDGKSILRYEVDGSISGLATRGRYNPVALLNGEMLGRPLIVKFNATPVSPPDWAITPDKARAK
eukprot:SAG11_NODE_12291_length_710_cov_2.248773_2_plen_80_part_01